MLLLLDITIYLTIKNSKNVWIIIYNNYNTKNILLTYNNILLKDIFWRFSALQSINPTKYYYLICNISRKAVFYST
jgi:hypothetical protein